MAPPPLFKVKILFSQPKGRNSVLNTSVLWMDFSNGRDNQSGFHDSGMGGGTEKRGGGKMGTPSFGWKNQQWITNEGQ